MSRYIAALGLALTLACMAAPAPAAAVGEHTIHLPDLRRMPLPGSPDWWSAPDAVAGAKPCPAHPRGTVYVVEAAEDLPVPTIAEYDVASGRRLRRADLPFDPVILTIRMVRTGDRLHVFAYARPRSPLIYVRLDASLQVEAKEIIGSVDGMSVGADDTLVGLLWCGTREGTQRPRGVQLLTLDASGNHVGDVFVSPSQVFMYARPIAVVGGKVYLLSPDGRLPSIARLTPDARVEDAQSVMRTPDDSAMFFVQGNELLMVDGCAIVTVPTDTLAAGVAARRMPYRPNAFHMCPYFDMASDAAGRFVTGMGDVLSAATLKVERHIADIKVREDYEHRGEEGARALWIGDVPAVLAYDDITGRLRLAWGDP